MTTRPETSRERHTVNVRTPFANWVGYCCRARAAGPFATPPDVVNCDPWHGHTKRLLSYPVIVQASWVQVAVRAVNESCAVRPTRNTPNEVCTIAAEPTAARADAESTLTDTTLPAVVAATDASCGAESEGDVGLPPHAAATAPTARSEAA